MRDAFALPVNEVFYPEIDGLLADVLRRPMWHSDLPREESGFQARVGYWEWELHYRPSEASHECDFAQLEDFFRSSEDRGFFYRDADDHTVTGQYLGAGDGETRRFRLIHAIAEATDGIVAVEPIAWLDREKPFALYLDDAEQSRKSYAVRRDERGHPFGDHFVDFSKPPPFGASVRVDMSHYFVAAWADDSYPWENFTRQLRALHKVSLISRPAARWPTATE